MADYVSRDPAPEDDELAPLDALLHEHELGAPADLAFVLTARRQPAGDPRTAVEVLWSDGSIRTGDAAVTAALAGGCARCATVPDLPAELTMGAGEVPVIAGDCDRLTREGSFAGGFVAGDVYRLHALSGRDPSEPPAAPAFLVAAPRSAPASPSITTPRWTFAGIHHAVMDNIIWRRENPESRRYLFET